MCSLSSLWWHYDHYDLSCLSRDVSLWGHVSPCVHSALCDDIMIITIYLAFLGMSAFEVMLAHVFTQLFVMTYEYYNLSWHFRDASLWGHVSPCVHSALCDDIMIITIYLDVLGVWAFEVMLAHVFTQLFVMTLWSLWFILPFCGCQLLRSC